MTQETESTQSLELPEESQQIITSVDSEPDKEMNFIGHLEEIRSRLIKSALALLIVMTLCATFADFLVNEILIGPLKRSSQSLVLQNLVPYGQLSLYFQVVFFAGFIISFPFIAWQIEI